MKLISSTAIVLASAGIATPAAAAQYGAAAPPPPRNGQAVAQAPAQAQPQVKPSAKAVKAILDLQTTVNNKDYANVPAKVAAAQAVATTKEDRYLIARLQLNAAVAQNDNATMAQALDAVAQSGYLDSSKMAGLYLGLGANFYNSKQYPQAVVALQKATAMDPNNAEASRLYGVALFQTGRKADAFGAFQKTIHATVAAGKKPEEDLYKLAVQSAFDTKSPEAPAIAREWLAAYPSPESWRNAIAIYRNLGGQDTEGTLDLLRLMQATGSLQNAGDYALFATADAEQNNWNEAQAVLNAGEAAHVVNPAAPDMRDIVAAVKAKPKATAADLAAATKAAVNGTALLHIGDRYYAMGDYPKAVELYRMALGKPGVDTAVANLHIGMALARQGDKAGATTALNSVTGPRADIAKYWLIYVNQKA